MFAKTHCAFPYSSFARREKHAKKKHTQPVENEIVWKSYDKSNSILTDRIVRAIVCKIGWERGAGGFLSMLKQAHSFNDASMGRFSIQHFEIK